MAVEKLRCWELLLLLLLWTQALPSLIRIQAMHQSITSKVQFFDNPVNSNPRFSPWNMVGEVVLEEVPRLLSSDGEHCHQVCRMHPVSRELEAHAWRCRHSSCVWLQCKRKPTGDGFFILGEK